jgi:hypothetical protein
LKLRETTSVALLEELIDIELVCLSGFIYWTVTGGHLRAWIKMTAHFKITLTASQLIFLSLSSTLGLTRAMETETLMQDFPEYTSAAETKPCATECAITPSAAFKTKYACDPVNPVSCICANGTASVELRDSMSQYCYDKCDGLVGPHLATSILAAYCGQDWEGKTITNPPPGPSTTTTSESSASASASSTAISDASGGGVTKTETIILATVLPTLSLIVAVVGVVLNRRRKQKKQKTTEGLELPDVPAATHGSSN